MRQHVPFRAEMHTDALAQRFPNDRQLRAFSGKIRRRDTAPPGLCVCTFLSISQAQASQQYIASGFAALLRCKSILILVISHPWSFDCG
ncbi:hypothetical protein [Paraburkholderia phytofirmans]|uniref:hypothetical protein n=1 Tax=Paraburkholderia phytofirmans TaxID=261302 RepID=UPI0000E7A837|nr:hypothetical protein [Paraburkholderia phytofirmans]